MQTPIHTVALCACSNGQAPQQTKEIEQLRHTLASMGLSVIMSDCIYAKDGLFSGNGKERARALMNLFNDPDIDEIYDISGGDLANQLLPYLDYDQIRRSKAAFWGYSDLTTIINAIYTKSQKESVLYQVKNMVRGGYETLQKERFQERNDLFQPDFSFIQGENKAMEGILVGGNIRCFLKLAGTEYFPDLTGKLLLLEASLISIPF